MFEYLYEHHHEEWGRIALEKSYWFKGGPSLLFFDKGISDPKYRELRNYYKRVRRALIFSVCAYFLIFIYAAATTASS